MAIIFLFIPSIISWWAYGICWLLGGPGWLNTGLFGIACAVTGATVLLLALRSITRF